MSKVIGYVIAWILVIVVVAVLLALPIMILWNLVMPDIFGLTTIDFKQALVIALLSRCLFSGGVSTSGKEKNK